MQQQTLPEQLRVFNELAKWVAKESPSSPRVIQARAGWRKTFVVEALAAFLRAQSQIVLLTGQPALAASNYERGRTVHNTIKMPVSENHEDVSSLLDPSSARADLIRAAVFNVVDEVFCLHRIDLEAVAQFLRQLTSDKHQCGPVVISSVYDASIRSSYLWHQFQSHSLTLPVRNALDPEFSAFWNTIGNGETPARVDLRQYLRHVDDLYQSLDALYPDHVLTDPMRCVKRAWLTPINANVDEMNAFILQRLPERKCESTFDPMSTLAHCCCRHDVF